METMKTGLASRDNADKLPWSLVDWEAMRHLATIYHDGWNGVNFNALEEMLRVLMFGAKKYAPNAWKKGMLVSSTLDSLIRHTIQLMKGETHDKESGLSHYGHILCNIMFVSRFVEYNPELDDRQNILDPEIIVHHPVLNEKNVLNTLLEYVTAFQAGQKEDAIDGANIIGQIMHFACVGYSLQNSSVSSMTVKQAVAAGRAAYVSAKYEARKAAFTSQADIDAVMNGFPDADQANI